MAKNHIVELVLTQFLIRYFVAHVTLTKFKSIAILRDVDPGAVSGGGKKSKRARKKSGFLSPV